MGENTIVVTICIPVGPYHQDIADTAITSAYGQTLPCAVRVYHDTEGYGPGFARNRLLELVDTPFVVFLDADDRLEPDFAQETIKAYRRGHYVYTDWYEDDVPQTSPECDEWVLGKTRIHLVTTLLPMGILRRLKGFDETLPGIEDTDLYLRMRTRGYCGIRVPLPLVHYGSQSQRHIAFRANPERDIVRRVVWKRYQEDLMGCCDNQPVPSLTGGEHLDGDVVVETLYPPRTEFGPSGRFYKRPTHQGAHVWVSRFDAERRPDLWRIIEDPEAATPDVDFVLQLARQGLA